MTEKIIEIEAETLEEARAQVKSQIPEGLHLLSEQVLSDGTPKTVKAVADTTESAFAKAQSEIPTNATILEKKELSAPAQRVITVQAFDERSVASEARRQLGEATLVKSLKLTVAGKKGFLGIGKTPNQYEAKVFQQAVVEITYKARAKVSATVGKLDYIVGSHLREKGYYKKQIGTEKVGYFDPLKVVFRLFDEHGRRVYVGGGEGFAFVFPPPCGSSGERMTFTMMGSTLAEALEAYPEGVLLLHHGGDIPKLVRHLERVGEGEVDKFIFESTVLPFFQRYSLEEKVLMVDEIVREVRLSALFNFLCSEVVRPPGVEDVGVEKMRMRAIERVREIRKKSEPAG